MSDFGERIYKLRNSKNLSQSDLADRLDVSRQTVSKWENGMCMPETEKLVQLSTIFKVSVDYILKGEEGVNEPIYIYVKEDNGNQSKVSEKIVRKYVGIVLAVLFSVLAFIMIITGGYIAAIIPGAVVLLGILLASNVKHPWLITFWVTYIVLIAVLHFISAITPFMIFEPIIYTPGYTYHLLWGYGIWIVLLILIVSTIITKKRSFLKNNKTEN